MLKSFSSGIGSGLGRIVGKVIGLGIIGLLAYQYIQKTDTNIDEKIEHIVEGVIYEK